MDARRTSFHRFGCLLGLALLVGAGACEAEAGDGGSLLGTWSGPFAVTREQFVETSGWPAQVVSGPVTQTAATGAATVTLDASGLPSLPLPLADAQAAAAVQLGEGLQGCTATGTPGGASSPGKPNLKVTCTGGGGAEVYTVLLHAGGAASAWTYDLLVELPSGSQQSARVVETYSVHDAATIGVNLVTEQRTSRSDGNVDLLRNTAVGVFAKVQ